MADTHKKYGENEQVPSDVFSELATSHEELSLRALRRNDRGQFQTVYAGFLFRTDEMIYLDAWLKAHAGGGKFFIEVRRPEDKAILFTYHLPIEGAPRPAIPLDAPAVDEPPSGYHIPNLPMMTQPVDDDGSVSFFPHVPDLGGDSMTDPARPLPPAVATQEVPSGRWAQNLPPDQRRNFAMAAGVSTIPSDQLAMQQVQKLEAETAKLRAALDTERQKSEERLRTLEQQVVEQRAAAERARHEGEMKALSAKIEALMAERSRPVEPVAPKQDLASIVAALAPLAPVLVALIQSNRASADKALEIQHQGMNQVMTAALATANRPAPDPLAGLKELLPLAIPLIQNMIASKSPEAQATMISAMADSQMQTAAMYAQLLESMANMSGPSEPRSMVSEILPHVFAGIQKIGEAMAAQSGAQPQQARQIGSGQPQHVVQHAPQQRPPQAPSAHYQTVDDAPQAPVIQANQQVVADTNPPDVTSAPVPFDVEGLVAFLPEGMRTGEWRAWLTMLHRGTSSRQMGGTLAHLVVSAMENDQLPADMVENINRSPVDALRGLASFLPITAQNGPYVESVIHWTMISLSQMVAEATAEEEEEEGDEDEGAESAQEPHVFVAPL